MHHNKMSVFAGKSCFPMLGRMADERQMDHNNLNYIMKTVNCL